MKAYLPAPARHASPEASRSAPMQQVEDNRPETLAQQKLRAQTENSPMIAAQRKVMPVQRMRDSAYTQIDTLGELNDALRALTPTITGVDSGMFGVRGLNTAIINHVISNNNTNLFNGIKRKDVLDALKTDLAARVAAAAPAGGFVYDTHGDKHFPGGAAGTKFTAGSGVVNPQLVGLIQPVLGRIRRHANGKNKNYYLTQAGIAQCGGLDLTIQVDFNYADDSITYHGYPDGGVAAYSLSTTKGGAAIP